MKKALSAVIALAMIFSMSVFAQARLAGDVNKDGTVNSLDALDVLMFSTGKEKMIDSQRADINTDNKINAEDALNILYIATGSYSGALKINDEFITTLKKDYVDPVLKSAHFTIKMTLIAEGQEMPMTMAVDNTKMYVSMTTQGMDVAILSKNGKTYILMPNLLEGVKIYMEYDEDGDIMTDIVGSVTSVSDIEADYTGSSKIRYGTKNYVCEEYKDEYGNVYKYYFEGTSWKRFECISEGETLTYEISSFTNTVDSKLFSLSGYIKVDPNTFA